MNSLSKIETYIGSVIPQNISKKKKQKLYDELYCHILDKADFYKEIGYSEEQSIDKAIEDVGTDAATKNYLCDEFEELYHERTWWAFIFAAIILLMNFLCFPLGTWVTSVDSNSEPTEWKILVSSLMIFCNFALIRYAEIKRYRKTLLGIGISNLLIAVSVIWCFYPQAAIYAAETNFYLIVDKYMSYTIYPETNCFYALSFAFTFAVFVYCVAQSIRIKKNTAGKKTKTGTVILTVCFVLLTAVNTGMYDSSISFAINYPTWFDYLVYSSEEFEPLFDEIKIGNEYEDVNTYLNSKGWITFSDYEKSLDEDTAKKFRLQCKENADFGSEYIVWFNPESNIPGNCFVFAKADKKGCIIEKGIGNPTLFNPGEDYEFRYYSVSEGYIENMQEMYDYWDTMKIGDSQEEIMSRFSTEYGTVYSHIQTENSESFAVYTFGASDYSGFDSKYLVLSFADGMLTRGDMYWNEFDGHKDQLCKSSIK